MLEKGFNIIKLGSQCVISNYHYSVIVEWFADYWQKESLMAHGAPIQFFLFGEAKNEITKDGQVARWMSTHAMGKTNAYHTPVMLLEKSKVWYYFAVLQHRWIHCEITFADFYLVYSTWESILSKIFWIKNQYFLPTGSNGLVGQSKWPYALCNVIKYNT